MDVPLGGRELVVHNRYEVLSIVNDILVALWFIIGSILFFQESTTTAGTWLFLIGSIELLVRRDPPLQERPSARDHPHEEQQRLLIRHPRTRHGSPESPTRQTGTPTWRSP